MTDETPEQPDRSRLRDDRTGRSAAANRVQDQSRWVDLQIQQAMARGDFDNLPGAGKPIQDLGGGHDPDWWLKKLIEREQITGVLPPALQLRKEDAGLDDRLDRCNVESEVRREVEAFNQRVLKARYTPVDGPPLITQPRDVEETVAAWRERRASRPRPPRGTTKPQPPQGEQARRRWWRRR